MRRISNFPVTAFAVVLLTILSASPVFPIGILAPSEPNLQPLSLTHQSVTVEITDQAARTKVSQTFHNDLDRALEGHYLFPVPKGAQVTDFILYINGKPQRAEVLERDKARKIYEDIVSRMKDPGLLEYMDQELFRVRVFPIPARGDQKVEIEYVQVLTLDHGAAEYVFPVRTAGEPVHENTAEMDFDFTIESAVPLKTVYSPSHKVTFDSKSEHKISGSAVVSQDRADRNLTLIYTVSEKEVGLAVLPLRRISDEPGYFSILISPKIDMPEKEIQAKAVTFVLDTSGSMTADNKMEQARNALIYCLKNLRKQDYFNVIQFASTVEPLHEELRPATPEAIEVAVEWVKTLESRGGTNIDEALQEALKAVPPKGTSHTIVFMTDGVPTVGETQPDGILKNLDQRNEASLRVFTFGLGYDVNAKLLDSIADQTRSTSQYVRPDEDIEVSVSAFFDKVSSPVLTNLELEIEGVKTREIFPRQLPDLFLGSQLIVFGRYEYAGQATVRLTGQLGDEEHVFEYTAEFPKTSDRHRYIESLWAHRKVGYLLEEIRKHGEEKEVVDEVVQLAKKYGIATPYTSFLVTEDEPVMVQAMPLTGGRAAAATPRPTMAPSDYFAARPRASRMPRSASDSLGAMAGAQEKSFGVPAAQAPMELKAESGRQAVESSIQLRDYKEKEQVGQDAAVMRASGRSFIKQGEVWVDQTIEKRETMLEVKAYSKAYFEILKLRPDLAEALALGEQVEVRLDQKTVLKVGPDGKETLDEKDRVLVNLK